MQKWFIGGRNLPEYPSKAKRSQGQNLETKGRQINIVHWDHYNSWLR